MSRVNTNIPSLVAQRILGHQNTSLNHSLDRLSTGLRINSGKDDPAGLIASETMRAEKRAIGAAISNVGRAVNVISVAESGLNEISKLLLDLEDLVDRSANEAAISEGERNANQLEVDAILESINRIANSTELQGRKLLNGTLAYSTSAVVASQIGTVRINSARIPNGGYRSVTVNVVSGAELARVNYTGGTITGSSRTIEIVGRLGTEVLTFGSGTTVSQIAAAINLSKELTGVSAIASSTGAVKLYSTGYGSSEFVRVNMLAGSLTFSGGIREDAGKDAHVRINGVRAISSGLDAQINSTTLSAELTLSTAFGTGNGLQSTFHVTGGGADFMISPTVNQNGIASIGIEGLNTSRLGNSRIGFLFTLGSGQTNELKSNNYAKAQEILREASKFVSTLRGRLGSFQKDTLETVANSLRVTLENVTAAESTIRDTDFANETSNLTRAQILVQSASNVLRLANQQPQNVLGLLQ